MRQPWQRAIVAGGVVAAGCLLLSGCAGTAGPRPLGSTASEWRIEAEQPARVTFGETIDIDTPAGLSLWYTRALTGPGAIEFEAMAVAVGGANDAVSDLNAFWMASDALLKWKTPVSIAGAAVTSKYQPSAAAQASVMKPRFQ